MLEGHKVLFRVALAIFRMHEAELAMVNGLEDLMTFSRWMVRRLVSERNPLTCISLLPLLVLSFLFLFSPSSSCSFLLLVVVVVVSFLSDWRDLIEVESSALLRHSFSTE